MENEPSSQTENSENVGENQYTEDPEQSGNMKKL